MTRRLAVTVIAPLTVWALSSTLFAGTATSTSASDNTLYEVRDGHLSNGAGDWFFAGKTFTSFKRRGLLRFDLSGIPANAVIESATLTLHHSLGQPVAADISLHRSLGDWGEGTSNPEGNEGAGIDATPGDATWLHTSYDTAFWTNPGGDFIEAASATTPVGPDLGLYTWSGEGLVADIQAWVEGSAANYGWEVIGDEVARGGTSKRFGTHEHPIVEERPTLVITWSMLGDIDGDGVVGAADLAVLLGGWGQPGTTDLDGDGTTGASDLAILLGAWSV